MGDLAEGVVIGQSRVAQSHQLLLEFGRERGLVLSFRCSLLSWRGRPLRLQRRCPQGCQKQNCLQASACGETENTQPFQTDLLTDAGAPTIRKRQKSGFSCERRRP